MSDISKAMIEAKGAGAGHNGTRHFLAQRISAVILAPLVLYLLYALIRLVHADEYREVLAWFADPCNAGLAIAFVLSGFFHAALGTQVVIEDYLHKEKTKWLALLTVNGLFLVGAAIAVVSILRLALTR